MNRRGHCFTVVGTLRCAVTGFIGRQGGACLLHFAIRYDFAFTTDFSGSFTLGAASAASSSACNRSSFISGPSMPNWKPDFSATNRLIIQFSHPRLADELEVSAPILCAWGGEPVMQRAAARVLLREVAAGTMQRSAGTA